MPCHHDVAVRLSSDQGQFLESQLRDISLDGVSVQTNNGETPAWLRQGATLLCDLALGKAEARVVTAIEIRHVRANPRNHTQVVGTRFTGLDGPQRRKIQRYIANIERDMVRNRVQAG